MDSWTSQAAKPSETDNYYNHEGYYNDHESNESNE